MMGTEKKIVLRHIKKPDENREHYLSIELKENGDLFLDGWDVTPVAKDFYGDSEYEYTKTIKNQDLHYLKIAFNVVNGKDILEFLEENFSGEKSFEFERLLNENNVPFELDVW